MKDFDNFMSSKRIMKYVYQKKIDLTQLTINKVWCFLNIEKYPGRASIHRINELFPLKPSLKNSQ